MESLDKAEVVPVHTIKCNGFGKALEPAISDVKQSLRLAVNYSLENVESDGHWYGELK